MATALSSARTQTPTQTAADDTQEESIKNTTYYGELFRRASEEFGTLTSTEKYDTLLYFDEGVLRAVCAERLPVGWVHR